MVIYCFENQIFFTLKKSSIHNFYSSFTNHLKQEESNDYADHSKNEVTNPIGEDYELHQEVPHIDQKIIRNKNKKTDGLDKNETYLHVINVWSI